MNVEPAGASELDRYIKDELREMIRAVTDSRLRTLEIRHGEVSLMISRARHPGSEVISSPPVGTGQVEAFEDDTRPNIKLITAPIVGTFFHSEQPDRPALVSEGSRVEQGALIGVIEALQVLTEVETDAAGTVQRILVDDGSAVEYGQALVELLLER